MELDCNVNLSEKTTYEIFLDECINLYTAIIQFSENTHKNFKLCHIDVINLLNDDFNPNKNYNSYLNVYSDDEIKLIESSKDKYTLPYACYLVSEKNFIEVIAGGEISSDPYYENAFLPHKIKEYYGNTLTEGVMEMVLSMYFKSEYANNELKLSHFIKTIKGTTQFFQISNDLNKFGYSEYELLKLFDDSKARLNNLFNNHNFNCPDTVDDQIRYELEEAKKINAQKEYQESMKKIEENRKLQEEQMKIRVELQKQEGIYPLYEINQMITDYSKKINKLTLKIEKCKFKYLNEKLALYESNHKCAIENFNIQLETIHNNHKNDITKLNDEFLENSKEGVRLQEIHTKSVGNLNNCLLGCVKSLENMVTTFSQNKFEKYIDVNDKTMAELN
jgi:hypothetical protein